MFPLLNIVILLLLNFDTAELCVDFAGTLTGSPTVFLSVKSFLCVGVAQPLVPRGVQFAAVDPQISVRTGIGAQFAQLARTFTPAARRALLVRPTQTLHVIASVNPPKETS